MVDFKVKLDTQINNLYTHLKAIEKRSNERTFVDINNFKAFVEKNVPCKFDSNINLSEGIQKYSSDKVTLLKISQYCKLKGIHDCLTNNISWFKVVTHKEVPHYVEPWKLFGYEIISGYSTTRIETIETSFNEFITKNIESYETLARDVKNLSENRFYGKPSQYSPAIIFKGKDINQLSVKTDKLKADHRLTMDMLVDSTQFQAKLPH